jgi:hypothetical protein
VVAPRVRKWRLGQGPHAICAGQSGPKSFRHILDPGLYSTVEASSEYFGGVGKKQSEEVFSRQKHEIIFRRGRFWARGVQYRKDLACLRCTACFLLKGLVSLQNKFMNRTATLHRLGVEECTMPPLTTRALRGPLAWNTTCMPAKVMLYDRDGCTSHGTLGSEKSGKATTGAIRCPAMQICMCRCNAATDARSSQCSTFVGENVLDQRS